MLASNMLTKDQMLEQYDVDGFFYDICLVTRRSDGVRGTLQYSACDGPSGYARYYYNFVEE